MGGDLRGPIVNTTRVKWRGIRRTVFNCQCANNIPTNPTNVDPPNPHPRFSLAGSGIIEEGNELTVGHPPKTAPDARVIRNLNLTTLPNMPVVEGRSILTDVDPRFRARSFPRKITGGFVEAHHLPYRHAETLAGSERRLVVGHLFLDGSGPHGPFGLERFCRL